MSEDYSLGTYSKLAEVAEKKKTPIPDTPKAEKSAKTTVAIPRYHDTTVPSNHDIKSHDNIEIVRKAVKSLGEKAATHRFTSKEKEAIADIVYAYKKKGIITSENEISRIAINYLVLDYQQRKDESILSSVLERLNA